MKKFVLFTIIAVFFIDLSNGFAMEANLSEVSGDAYFDNATGHKYVKNQESTYTEFTRKGHLFKENVPATQPHLNSKRYMIKLQPNLYVVYKGYKTNREVFQVLPASVQHPEGWQSVRTLSSLAQLAK